MLSTAEFREFAKGVVPFLHVTSQVEGDKYPDLLSEKGGRGFPHVVCMDAEGGVLAVLNARTVDGFKDMMKRGAEFQALVAKKDRTPAEELSVLKAELGLGRLKPEEARARATALKGLDEAAKKELDGLLLGLDIRAEMAKITRENAKEGRIAAGKAFAEMWKAGREPTDEDTVQPFFILMLDYAESIPDAALFEKALGELQERFGDKPQAAGFLKKQEERLAKLKGGAGPPKEGGK